MNQIVTEAIVLGRTDYGEADRIITLLTPEQGKLRLMARGVRKPKSKLAGGIELFSTSHITYINGRGEIGTLISSRLIKHYSDIVHDIMRVQLGYDLIKLLNRATEDHPEAGYYQLLQHSLEALDDAAVSLDIIRPWFDAQLLRLGGHTPNLTNDILGKKLENAHTYNFDFESMAFAQNPKGKITANHIKFLRLIFGGYTAKSLANVQGAEALLPLNASLIQTMLRTHIRI